MKNKKLIAISGKKGSGKDTFYAIAERYILHKYTIQYDNKKFADKLKEVSSLLTGRPLNHFYDRSHYLDYLEEWGMTIREFMQKIGTEAMRVGLHPNCWVISLFSNFDENSKWIITDCRFKNEAEYILKQNGYLIRVNRKLDSNDTHQSEVDLDDYDKFDYIIDNNGTLEEFERNIKQVIDDIYTLS